MNTPKVNFTYIPLSVEVDWIHGFLFQNKYGWGKCIIQKHPAINKIFSLEDESEQINFLRKYVSEFRKEKKKVIEQNKIFYNNEWLKIEKVFFTRLSEILQIEWPNSKKTIKAMISINPISPRFLDDWSFSLFYHYKKTSHAMEVIMHESCHFLYFEKFKTIYPNISSEKFEYPYIEWHLSEIIAPIILNDNRIQSLLRQKAFFYEEHQKLKIENKSVPEYFFDLYENSKKEQEDFKVFLGKACKIIKNNKQMFIKPRGNT